MTSTPCPDPDGKSKSKSETSVFSSKPNVILSRKTRVEGCADEVKGKMQHAWKAAGRVQNAADALKS